MSMDIEQLPAQLRAQLLSYRDRFETELSALETPVRGMTDRVNALAQLVEECRSNVLGGEQGGSTGFGKFNSFDSFLLELRKKWDGVVLNEREALEKAIYHYQEAFAGGRDIAPGNQQLQATYLIAELSRRAGRHEEARSYFTNTIKNGQEFIHANRNDQTRTALARKILELAIEQGKLNLAAVQKVSVA
jgi:tetratricopeptide (TPR) repeat protein